MEFRAPETEQGGGHRLLARPRAGGREDSFIPGQPRRGPAELAGRGFPPAPSLLPLGRLLGTGPAPSERGGAEERSQARTSGQ